MEDADLNEAIAEHTEGADVHLDQTYVTNLMNVQRDPKLTSTPKLAVGGWLRRLFPWSRALWARWHQLSPYVLSSSPGENISPPDRT